MAKPKSSNARGYQLRSTGTEALEAAQATQAGAKFEWHFGRV